MYRFQFDIKALVIGNNGTDMLEFNSTVYSTISVLKVFKPVYRPAVARQK